MIPMISTGSSIYSDSSKTDDHLADILKDADKLLEICGQDFDEVTEYQLLVRCLSEQTVVQDAVRRFKEKGEGTMNSSMMQNPSDPDATFRKKAGKEYRGYTANVEESVGKNDSIVTDYQFEQNTYSDSQFLQDSLARNGVETVPSILKRIYHADRMQVRGCIPSRFFFGCKVAALNVRKLITFRKGWGHYAQNPILAI